MLEKCKFIPFSLALLIASNAYTSYATTITAEDLAAISSKQKISINNDEQYGIDNKSSNLKPTDLIYNLHSMTNKRTGLAPDYWGDERFANYAALSHKMNDAIAYFASGYQEDAEKILDYFARRLDIPKEVIDEKKDSNNNYGILKLITHSSAGTDHVGILDGIATNNNSRAGKALSNFFVAPRSLAMSISAFLHVNQEKYKKYALLLGETLLAFQDSENGAILDNDRIRNYTHSADQIAAYSAFVMLSQIDDDPKWAKAAEDALYWFNSRVFSSSHLSIAQGFGDNKDNSTYTTSAYTSLFLSPAADDLSITVIKSMTDKILENSLCNVSLYLPDGRWIQATLADEYNPKSKAIIDARGELHPRGSFEQTVYLILMLQKNSVRLINHDFDAAKSYKAIAESLTLDLSNTFYNAKGLRGLTSFSDTIQNKKYIELGANPTAMQEEIYSPYFYVKNPEFPEQSQIGSTSISSMFNLIFYGINPFVLNDDFSERYISLPISDKHRSDAVYKLKLAVREKIINEPTPEESETDITFSEPGKYNEQMWKYFSQAEGYKNNGDMYNSRISYEQALEWALKTVNNTKWYLLAMTENKKKSRQHNGLIDYPYGITFPGNDSSLHNAILRYPILNEMGAAMWAIAVINYEFANREEAKSWIRKIIEDFPLHQIPTTAQTENGKERLINGYWNALEAWEDNPNQEVRDQKMQSLYMEVLKEMGLETAKPKKVKL